MKVSIKRIFRLLFLATLCSTISLLLYLHQEPSIESMDDRIAESKFDPASFKRIDLRTRRKLHYSNYVSDYYLGFKSTVRDMEELRKKPLDEKCQEFFEDFDKKYPQFEYTIPRDWMFDKGVSKKKTFFDIEYNRMRLENDGIELERTTELNHLIREKYDKRVEDTYQATKEMAEMSTLMRAYGKCFINTNGKLMNDKQKSLYDHMTLKLFPYFNGLDLVSYETIDNSSQLIPLDGYPVYGGAGEIITTIPKGKNNENIMETILNNTNGKGIAIVASNRHGRDIIKLLRVLRAMNNTLPIEIIYNNDITQRVKNNIIASATVGPNLLLDPNKSGSYISVYPDLDLLKASKEFGSQFPIQKVTFVGYREAIRHSYRAKFKGYYSKIIGLLFTTFKEVVLIDADTIPFVDMKDLFELEDYKQTGSLFFRDRALRDTNDFIETNFFASLFPTKDQDSLEQLLEIPTVTNKTLANTYMTGYRHQQEAGMVIMDRVKHFKGILMMPTIALTGEAIRLSIWGEKEIYWLGLSMAGDEAYAFNKYAAASIGSLSSNDHTYYPKDPQIHEVCLSHPGHIYKDGRLLWINSGFSYCKKNGSLRDSKIFPLNTIDPATVVNLYSSPVKISHGVVPPDLPPLRLSDGQHHIDYNHEETFIQSWTHRAKDIDEVDDTDKTPRISDWIPQKGWIKSPMCSGYYYCAYDQIASYSNDNTRDQGAYFEFPQEKVDLYDFLGKLWMTGDARLT